MARFLRVALLACLAAAVVASSRTAYGNGRIVGGSPADPAEYPSQVSLRALGSHSCGASIISENWVLTAGHCVELMLPGWLEIHANSNHLITNGTSHEVVRFIQHAGFNFSDFTSEDIAVIEVTPPFEFSETAQPAVLPEQDVETPAGSPAVVIGWGFVDTNGPVSPSLLEVDQVVRDYQDCFNIYTPDVNVTTEQICADVPEGGKGICSGDSGGPLFVDGLLVGLVSWSANGCAAEGFPGVYTRVASYRDWIRENTGV
ncbi:trypsin-7-like [Cloeon dipterum]|uniref:trypsin-7-like n=1 Tax=Cloeon dipterum TaxID=197152 RepID=UPI00321FE705